MSMPENAQILNIFNGTLTRYCNNKINLSSASGRNIFVLFNNNNNNCSSKARYPKNTVLNAPYKQRNNPIDRYNDMID